MEFIDYLRILRRRRLLVLAAPLIAFAIAAAVTVPDLQPWGSSVVREFEATHILYRPSASEDQVPLETVGEIASTRTVERRVDRRLRDDGVQGRASAVAVVVDKGMRTLSLRTVQADPETAEALVDTYAAELIAYFEEDPDGDVEREVKGFEKQLDRVQSKIADLDEQLAQGAGTGGRPTTTDERDRLLRRSGRLAERIAAGSGSLDIGMRTLQSALATAAQREVFDAPATPGPRLLLATLMGLVMGVALAFVVDRIDTRIRTRDDAQDAFSLPVLAEVPRLPRRGQRRRDVVTAADPVSAAAEAYRVVRLGTQVMSRWKLERSTRPGSLGTIVARQIESSAPRHGGQVILVASPGSGEGKTTTVANLAASFAELGQRVLVLDCDFRRPRLSQMLGVDEGPGVAEYVRDHTGQYSLAALARPSQIPNVWVLPSGQNTANPGELLGPQTHLLTEAAAAADVVLVDIGPLLSVNDGATLASQADAMVLVARHGQTTVEAANRASELLARIEASIAGVVLVGVPAGEFGGGYEYYGAIQTRRPDSGSAQPGNEVFPKQPQVVR